MKNRNKIQILLMFLSFTVGISFAHEEKRSSPWLKEHLKGSMKFEGFDLGEEINIKTKAFDEKSIKKTIWEVDGGVGMKPLTSKLVETKRIKFLEGGDISHHWDTCVGLFECKYPDSDKIFKVWSIICPVKKVGEMKDEVSKFMDSDDWKGVKYRASTFDSSIIIYDTICDSFCIQDKGEDIFFPTQTVVYIDTEGKLDVCPLPYRSSEGLKGLFEHWVFYSKTCMLSSLKIIETNDYGDKVLSVEFFIFDFSEKKLRRVKLKLDIAKLLKEPELTLKNGKKVSIAVKAIENPYDLVELDDGQIALVMFLLNENKEGSDRFILVLELE